MVLKGFKVFGIVWFGQIVSMLVLRITGSHSGLDVSDDGIGDPVRADLIFVALVGSRASPVRRGPRAKPPGVPPALPGKQ